MLLNNKSASLSKMLESDRTLYRELIIAWSNEIWLPAIQSELDNNVWNLQQNEQRFNDLLRAISNNNAIPFIGSGMSKPSGMPMWTPFMQTLADESNIRAKIDRLVQKGEFEKAATAVESKLTKRLFDRRIKETFNASSATIEGPVWFTPYVFGNIVITTNFDNILERTYNSSGKPFNDIIYGSRSDDYSEIRSPEIDKNYLVKIHGTYDKPSTRILTEIEYNINYAENSTIKNELAHLVESKSLVFLGCSLSNDRTMSLIKGVCESKENIRESFALLKSPTSAPEKLARDKFLSERNIFPIWYDGEHDTSIQAILVEILRRLERLTDKAMSGYI